MRKPTFCICKNKDADQLCSNCTADQRLCFRYTDSTTTLLRIYKVSSFYLSAVTVQAGLCHTWTEPQIVRFLMQWLKYLLRYHRYNNLSGVKLHYDLEVRKSSELKNAKPSLEKTVICSIYFILLSCYFIQQRS